MTVYSEKNLRFYFNFNLSLRETATVSKENQLKSITLKFRKHKKTMFRIEKLKKIISNINLPNLRFPDQMNYCL